MVNQLNPFQFHCNIHILTKKVTPEINFVLTAFFFLIKRGYNFEIANIMRLYANFNKNSKICDVYSSAWGSSKISENIYCVSKSLTLPPPPPQKKSHFLIK